MTYSYTVDLITQKGNELTAVYYVERESNRIFDIEIYGDFEEFETIDEFIIPSSFFNPKIDFAPVKILQLGEKVCDSDKLTPIVRLIRRKDGKILPFLFLTIKTLIIEEGIQKAAVNLFKGLGMVNVIWPSTITWIPDSCFYNCLSLKSITIPNEVREIHSRAFSYCKSLKTISIPKGVVYIYGPAFEHSGLTKITFRGKDVREIGNGCFAHCEELKSFNWPESCKKIYSNVFNGCKNLTSVNIKGNLNAIYESAFRGTQVEMLDLSSTTIRPDVYRDDDENGCRVEIIQSFYTN